MDGTSIAIGKAGIELLIKLGALIYEARKKKREAPREVMAKLRADAVAMAKSLDQSLDDVIITLNELKIDPDTRLSDLDRHLSKLSFVDHYRVRRVMEMLWRTAAGARELYADIEAIFLCGGQNEVIAASLDATASVRKDLNHLIASDPPVRTAIDIMRKVIGQAMKNVDA